MEKGLNIIKSLWGSIMTNSVPLSDYSNEIDERDNYYDFNYLREFEREL